MGYYVHISLAFSCNSYDDLAPIASKSLLEVDTPHFERHAKWFLEHLSEQSGTLPGPKGGICTWGMTGNGVSGQNFVEDLIPFWELLFKEEILLDFEHIVVFCEPEDSHVTVFEIYQYPEGCPESSQKGEMMIQTKQNLRIYRHEDVPFRWNQM